jgi:glycosyltransferase involved in cell wall biosynthesis
MPVGGKAVMRKLPVSCFIITKNEADRVTRTIRSVRSWVDEIVVVDSESADDTVAVAKREGARVIIQPWLGFGGQKRFAEDQCRNNWVFNIDADEVVTPELKEEILTLFESGPPILVAYGMPLRLVYPGAEKPRLWARDQWYVRLYNRRVVRFRDSELHDAVVTDGIPVGPLRAALLHYSMRSFDDMKQKLDERVWLSVKHADADSKARLTLRLFTEIPMNFLKYYVTRGHFTGGINGLRYASLQSWYRFLKIYRLWHLKPPRPRLPDPGSSRNGAAKSDNGPERHNGSERHETRVATEDPAGTPKVRVVQSRPLVPQAPNVAPALGISRSRW